VDGAIVKEQVPALSALNMRLRDDFVDDAAAGVGRWNKVIERAGIEFRLALPHVAFNRRIGEFTGLNTDAAGQILSDQEWARAKDRFLPTTDDNLYVAGLMRPVREAGAFAGWIAPPKVGIDNKPGNFEYVKIEDS
jgi:benzoyl-CoA 2,3-dioxygenase component B